MKKQRKVKGVTRELRFELNKSFLKSVKKQCNRYGGLVELSRISGVDYYSLKMICQTGRATNTNLNKLEKSF